MAGARRPYELKQRAARQRRTRARIVEAAMALHAGVGPARTSIAAIAERAGVQRHTVYRHFPTEEELFAACSATWGERHPFPDARAWAAIADPRERLRRALASFYEYYRQVEPDLSMFRRDAELVPAVARLLAEDDAQLERAADALMAGWRVRGARRARLRALIGHALEFETWRSLTRRRGLPDGHSAALMADAAAAIAG